MVLLAIGTRTILQRWEIFARKYISLQDVPLPARRSATLRLTPTNNITFVTGESVGGTKDRALILLEEKAPRNLPSNISELINSRDCARKGEVSDGKLAMT